jgi:hypothetical protein
MAEPFYVGYIGTDAVTGEHDTLADAQREVEAEVDARTPAGSRTPPAKDVVKMW